MVLLWLVTGYAAGTLLALTQDAFYPGAPLRGSLTLCHTEGEGAMPRRLWLGTLGFLLLRGRCPSGWPLPARLWYLPLLGATAAAVIAQRAVDGRHAALTAVFAVVLLALTGTDLERRLLPNRLLYPALALACFLCWAWPGRSWLGTLAGGMLGLGVMGAVFMLLPGFGWGDVKLALLLGLVSGVAHTPMALFVAMASGGLVAALLLLSRRAGPRTVMPYGPYLALGAFVGMLTP